MTSADTRKRILHLEDAMQTLNHCLKQLQSQQLSQLKLIALHEQWLRDLDPGWKERKIPQHLENAAF